MTEWSKDLVFYRMTRANETLGDARILANARRWNACVNRLYYACLYAVSALLVRHGFSSSKHAGVRSLFNRLTEDRLLCRGITYLGKGTIRTFFWSIG